MNDTHILVLPELDVPDVDYGLENFVKLNPVYADSPHKITMWLEWMTVTRKARLALLGENEEDEGIPF